MDGPSGRVDPRIFQLMAEQTKDYALLVLDPEGRVLTWNLGAQLLKGYAPEEIIGTHFSVFYAQEAVARGWPEHELQTAALEGRFEDEGWRVRKDGSRFWASVVITALRDESGQLLGFSKITRDQTERKAYEENLRQSEERFRLLVDGVVDYAIFMLDEQGIVTSWNAGAERIKGYRRDEIIGKHFSRFYLPEEQRSGLPWRELATARREGRAEYEGWRQRKDGERFWARTVLSVLKDTDGRLQGFAKLTQDLSDRRQIQDLEKAARNVNEFIAMLAHELRNPLAPVRLAVDMMGKLPPGDAEHRRLQRTLERQTALLAHIVDDMVDVSSITRGALSIERRPLNLVETLHQAVETAWPWVEAARHQLDIDVPEAIAVEGDAQRLGQVLTNLLNNAARYTPEGGRITLSAREEQGQAVVTVRDNGRGIDSDNMRSIFDMFVQGRTPLERVGGGLGVGLALSRSIAEMHGGSLDARSEGENRGSEFVLRLPLLQRTDVAVAPAVVVEEAPREESPAEPATMAAARRVLVVDDNIDAATSLDMFLRSLGHETRVAHGGRSALEAATAFRPDIVLLDIGMPDLDGYEVARRLRAANSDRPLRIVAVTGWGQAADRARSQAAGFDLHLVKPVGVDDLVQIVSEQPPTLH